MQSKRIITILVNNKNRQEELSLYVDSILYIRMQRNYALVHMADGVVHQTRMTFSALEELLADDFIRLGRGTLVSVMAIHTVTDKINLCNGESLHYVASRKNEILEKIRERQEALIRSFKAEEVPATLEEYHKHYQVFDSLPFAFTDIEMVFDKECRAIDWIFRYGNQALADIEKLSLDTLLGHSFRSLFPNMADKWLCHYERAALYGETLRIIDYSPEIDTSLEVICFPTFKGHCGCILFDVSKVQFHRESTDTERAMAIFIDKMLKGY